jgi:hypothetical protein
MAANRTTTGPREIWLENIYSNSGFSATIASDDWRYQAVIGPVPANTAHRTDTTAYATVPSEDSWYARYYGTQSPAKVTAGATGATRSGNAI